MNRHKVAAISMVVAALIAALYLLREHGGPSPIAEGDRAVGVLTSEVSAQTLADGYIALVPRVMRSAQRETIPVSLFNGEKPANGNVEATLLKDGKLVAAASGLVQGRGTLDLQLPELPQGDYQLKINGNSFSGESAVRVEDGAILFVESDKPIYKPGQTIHIRTLLLDTQLKPVSKPVSVEVMDSKGLKILKRDVVTDEFGMASFDFPLSSEPNLGVWKVAAKSGSRSAQMDLRVERYVLPKYEVKVETAKDWVLVDEPIRGVVSAEYSYGKPVQGEVQIRASRYVGSWQEYANVTKEIDGDVEFELPAVNYVSGVPGASGMGNVQLEVTVREKSTGYEEKNTKLITVSASPYVLKIIPDSVAFKPALPVSFLVTAETPDKKAIDADVRLDFTFTKKDFVATHENRLVSVKQGKALVQIVPPAEALSLTVGATSGKSYTSLAMQASYSPTGSFIHLEQVSQGPLKVGDVVRFKVTSTKQASYFYYEVLARGQVVFSDYSRSNDIQFTLTPSMAPSARLLVYQVLPSSEVAADYLPFAVQGDYPQTVKADFDRPDAKPGEQVDVSLQTEGQARVGLAAVDRSVFILAEDRVNLQQLFDELEKLYQKPQAELHEARPMGAISTLGAREVFANAGVLVLSNKQVPEGQKFEQPRMMLPMPAARAGAVAEDAKVAAPQQVASVADNALAKSDQFGGLAEVRRVRQLFPETWIWDTLTTDQAGSAVKNYQVPDSITTWMLRAVAISKEKGLGIAEAQLKVLQPFFVTVDLQYSVIRGEEFPVKVALYNYQHTPQDCVVEVESADWFQMLDRQSKSVKIGPNDVGAVAFTIKPSRLGTNKLKVTARSGSSADAIVKELIVEPEGVSREAVDNLVVSAGDNVQVDSSIPQGIIEGSARAFLTLTGSYLTQTIEGLEKLLQMPFGCGEQNMILFAPNVYVTQYLRASGQLKPEIMAKAEHLMITGYQRELTYRRDDGSFSAFGNQDKIGSLWLTAFVMKTFAQAKDLIFVDGDIINSASSWIAKQQKADGSFDPVGFVHHQELLGGMKGKVALTAYMAVALREAGNQTAAAKAISYLEGAIDSTEDPYGVALAAYALELAKSPKAADAYKKLMALAHQSDGGLYWGDEIRPLPAGQALPAGPMISPVPPERANQSAVIETTGYALLALVEHDDMVNASRAASWLASKRNAFGGFGSTQDTVVGLQALSKYSSRSKLDVDATVVLRSGGWQKELKVMSGNADVLQTVDLPLNLPITVEVRGKGRVVMQAVRRYNLPDPQKKAESAFQIQVDYNAERIEVNDLIDVRVAVKFTPPEQIQAGMVVVDVAVPTGFAPVSESLDALLKSQPNIKRYDLAGRKVIVYIEDMISGDEVKFSFKAQALYPVRAQAVTSQAYSYYRPDWKGESLSGAVEVRRYHLFRDRR